MALLRRQDVDLSTTQETNPLTNLFLCRRSETVEGIANILDEKTVAHVRGTPASGKTTLAYLLHDYYLQRNIPSVLISGWPEHDPYIPYSSHLARFANEAAQKSFNDATLWLTFIKYQSQRRWGAKVCLFSSYGSASEGPDEEFGFGSPLAYLSVQQRVTLTVSTISSSPSISIFFNRNEFNDFVQKKCSDLKGPLPLLPDAIDYIFGLTSGHPGAVDAILDLIQMVYQAIIKHRNIPAVGKDRIIEILNYEEGSFNHLSTTPASRSFVNQRGLTPEAADVLQEVLMNSNIALDLDNPGIKLCYRKGWLHSETLDRDGYDRVCVFPTRVHAKYAERILTDTIVPFPRNRFPTIETLAEEVLRGFSLRRLSSTAQIIGTAAVIRPVEAVYRDEFYRVLRKVLGFSINVSTEWSGDGNGGMDFRLPDLGWGIELLREGDGLGTHCERFVGNGSYVPLIQLGWLRNWLIIDCRTSVPSPYDVPGTKLWRAVFQSD